MPILLEGFIRRLSATNVFHRMQIRSELAGLIPMEIFAYRKHLSPQAAAMVGKLLIPQWCKKHGVLFSVDWDEKNAFCNVAGPRHDALTRHPTLRVERWTRSAFENMSVFVVSPLGSPGPFQMRHGGPQGSSKGMGIFNNMGIVRTWYNSAVWSHGMQSEWLSPGSYESQALFPCLPWREDHEIAGKCYSDDKRGFTLSQAGLSYFLLTEGHNCWSVGGSVNFAKLQLFKFSIQKAKLVLKAGKVDTVFGNFEFCKKEFAMTRIPMLMGHKPAVCLDKLCVRPQKIHATTTRLGPSFVLLLRVLIAYAIVGRTMFLLWC